MPVDYPNWKSFSQHSKQKISVNNSICANIFILFSIFFL